MDANYEREILAFDEKIALAQLEEAKAAERVRELEYQKARFKIDYLIAVSREQMQQQGKPNAG